MTTDAQDKKYGFLWVRQNSFGAPSKSSEFATLKVAHTVNLKNIDLRSIW